jgi:Ca2+-binding EF-hand superfamily protein
MNSGDKLPPLTNQQEARHLARVLFQRYDQNGSGYLEPNEIELMMRDIAKMGQSTPVYPGQFDIQSYVEVLDSNRDGRVCFYDVEAYVLNYFS